MMVAIMITNSNNNAVPPATKWMYWLSVLPSVTANLITKVSFSPELALEEQRYSPASRAVTCGRVMKALVTHWLQLLRTCLRYFEV